MTNKLKERGSGTEGITPQQFKELETYIDRLYSSLDIDVEFTKHFRDRVKDERNKKPITAAELIRLFREVYKRYGKRIARLTDDAQLVLQDMRTNINVPVVLNVDEKGDVDLEMVGKTIMRKPDFKTTNPTLTVEQRVMANPKRLLEIIDNSRINQEIKETMNGDTVSKKFFGMIEDTVSDFESAEGSLSDDERARLIAVFINGQARKYLSDAKQLWPQVAQKLTQMGAKDTPSQATPEQESEPVQTTPANRFGTPDAQPNRPGNPFYMEGENARFAQLGLNESAKESPVDPDSDRKLLNKLLREMQVSVGRDDYIFIIDKKKYKMDELGKEQMKAWEYIRKKIREDKLFSQLRTGHTDNPPNIVFMSDGSVRVYNDEGKRIKTYKIPGLQKASWASGTADVKGIDEASHNKRRRRKEVYQTDNDTGEVKKSEEYIQDILDTDIDE